MASPHGGVCVKIFSNAMKIVHILLTSRFAGTERYMIELANAQSHRHDVTVILHRNAAQARPDAWSHRLGPEVRQVHVSGWWWWAWAQVRRALIEIEPDVAHAHLSGGCRSLRGLRLSGLRLATLHIRYKPQQHADLDALIAIAPWQLAAIPAALQARTRQIDNWTDMRPFDPEARRRIRLQWGVAENEILVGAMGRMEPSKGMDLLIRAFSAVAQPGLRLALVGAGTSWSSLRQMAGQDVIMPGFAEHPHECLAAFDWFVSPARSEPFGLVMLEAMASGLPILATASEGAQHLAALIGRPLVPCNDVDALQAALQTIVSSRPQRQSYDLRPYQLDTQVAAIEDWYAQAMARVQIPRRDS